MRQFGVCAAAVCAVAGLAAVSMAAASPWATEVVSYSYNGSGDFGNNPVAALGEPTRLVDAEGWPGVASLFCGPWTPSEIVNVAAGGHLVVGFDKPIVDDPSHLYGADLIVFGHAAFNDDAYPNGSFGTNPSFYTGNEPGVIEVSADGQDWRVVPGVAVDALFPTLGYLDSGPFDGSPGSVPSDFLKPVNPSLTMASFAGLTYAEAVALYDGSGGGTPVDLASVGLSEARFARITVPQGVTYSVQVDAFAVVPEPMSLLLVVCGAGAMVLRRKAA